MWKVFSIPSPAPCAEGAEKKDRSYLQGDCSLRPGSQVNGKQLEFSYPFVEYELCARLWTFSRNEKDGISAFREHSSGGIRQLASHT